MNDELIRLLENNFEQKVLYMEKINGGWLSDKWRIVFDDYDVMVKIIANKKIMRRNIQIEKAAMLLRLLNTLDIKCPKIYMINEKLVNYNELGNPIVVIEYFKDTYSKEFFNITREEMYDLGLELGNMENILNNINNKTELEYKKVLKKMNIEYDKRVIAGKRNNNNKFLQDVYKQKIIIDSLTDKFFENLKIGYCHGDLSQDNILFDKNGLKAIIDFEITNISYTIQDIGRIFLTFCLDNNGKINKQLVDALLKGYNKNNKANIQDIIDGIRVIWCLEVNLWSKEEYYTDHNPTKVEKFIYEINWITDNWFKLEEIIQLE